MRILKDGMLQIIYDLVKINKVRVNCYRRIIVESSVLDNGLIPIFRNKAIENSKHAEELTNLLVSSGGGVSGQNLTTGKIFAAWNDNKKGFTGNDLNTMVNDCELYEQGVLEAYKAALVSESLDDAEGRKLIMDQKWALQISLDMIRKYCDLQELVFIWYDPVSMWNQNLFNIKAG